MHRRTFARHVVMIAALAVLMLGLTGCNYLKYRYEDFIEINDLGFTFTKTPQFSAYINCPTVIPIGYGKVDGYFVGFGQGKTGIMRHKHDVSGMLFWGKESSSYTAFDESEADTLSVQDVGLLGLTMHNETAKKKPVCIHYLHLGWMGVVWNLRWADIPDFFLGFAGLDFQQDDGPDGGFWFWKTDEPKPVRPKQPPTRIAALAPEAIPPAEASVTRRHAPDPFAVAGPPLGTGTPAAPLPNTPTGIPAAPLPELASGIPAAPLPETGPERTVVAAAHAPSIPDMVKAEKPVEKPVKRYAPLPTDASAFVAQVPDEKPVAVETVLAPTAETPEMTVLRALPVVYVVERGDTLVGIARKHYGDSMLWRKVYDANRSTIENPNGIWPGMKLVMPSGPEPKPTETIVARTYTVKSGDTFYGVARQVYGTGTKWRMLYDANRDTLDLTGAGRLSPGMVLRVPDVN